MLATTNHKFQTEKYWRLWVCPSANQQKALKTWPKETQDRVLLLHAKTQRGAKGAIMMAINSQLHESITAPLSLFSKSDASAIDKAGLAKGVQIIWNDSPATSKHTRPSKIAFIHA